MLTTAFRKPDGSIDHEATGRKVAIIGGAGLGYIGFLASTLAAMGHTVEVASDFTECHRPKSPNYIPTHERHQGGKECQRRLKRREKEVLP